MFQKPGPYLLNKYLSLDARLGVYVAPVPPTSAADRRVNQFRGHCWDCSREVPAGKGTLVGRRQDESGWKIECADCEEWRKPKPPGYWPKPSFSAEPTLVDCGDGILF